MFNFYYYLFILNISFIWTVRVSKLNEKLQYLCDLNKNHPKYNKLNYIG